MHASDLVLLVRMQMKSRHTESRGVFRGPEPEQCANRVLNSLYLLPLSQIAQRCIGGIRLRNDPEGQAFETCFYLQCHKIVLSRPNEWRRCAPRDSSR